MPYTALRKRAAASARVGRAARRQRRDPLCLLEAPSAPEELDGLDLGELVPGGAVSADRAEAARRLLTKIVNGLTARLETGAPMACSYLLGLPLSYSSRCFKPFFWYSFLSEVNRAWPEDSTELDEPSNYVT